jgi:hypothetical protein
MVGITLQNFINNFIQKDRRERVLLQLTSPKKRIQFTGKLNHEWDTILDMRRVKQIPKGFEDYKFAAQELKLSGKEPCIIISNHDEIDGQEKTFEQAFDAVYGRGFASIIVTASGDKMYLETELVQGRQNRFVGKI